MRTFKLQLSIDLKTVLIYDKNESTFGVVPASKELKDLFDIAGSRKIYVKGSMADDGMLMIEDLLENESW